MRISNTQFLPNRIDIAFRLLVHDDDLRPFAIKPFTAPFACRIDADLRPVAENWGCMVQDVHGTFDNDRVTLRIDVVSRYPGYLGKIMNVDVMINDYQNLSEHHLTHAPESVHDLARMGGVFLLDRDDRQVMEHSMHGQIHVDNLGKSQTQKRQKDPFGALPM